NKFYLKKFNTPDVAKLTDEMNDEARMSNDEANPNDETQEKRKCSFRHSSSSLIRRFRLPRPSLAKAGHWDLRHFQDAFCLGAATWSPTQACGSACRSF